MIKKISGCSLIRDPDGEGQDIPCNQQLVPGPECDGTCGQSEPPYEPCEEDGGGGGDLGPEPCETGGKYPALDDSYVQSQMNNLWQKSQDTGKEQAAFIYPNGRGGYAFNELSDHLVTDRTYDQIKFHKPSNLPDGTIYVHTHPDRQTLRKFGINRSYQHRPSNDDYSALSTMNVQKGFILDPDEIITYNSNKITDSLDRCSY